MRNSEYWQQRFTILEQAELARGEEYLAALEREYRTASARIQDEIAAWYNRFAANNEISLAEARRLLTTRELAEFRWTVEEYIKYGQENVLNGQWMKQLENASARVHVSRLESLQIQLQQQAEILYGNQLDGLDKLVRNIYTDGYYHTAYEIQRGFSVGWDIQRLNSHQLNRALTKPWTTDRQTFRDRCWTQKQQLVGAVQTKLTQAFIRGDAPDRAIKAIAEEFAVAKHKAGRLVMTESAFFASEAQMHAFRELDVKYFKVVATLDKYTCEICGSLDGEVLRMSDYEPGVTAPPFHPWCRCCTCPWFDDNFGVRAARGADGKTYYVPDTMKYEEWKRTFVDGGAKKGAAVQLSDSELGALHRYVSSEAYVLNEKLRLGESLTKQEQELMLYLDAALEKMPPYRGTLTRSVDLSGQDLQNFLNEHIIGKEICYPAYTSFTCGEVYEPAFNILLHVESGRGRDITPINPVEQEILYPRGSSFEVKQVVGNEIYLEEI